MENSTNIKEKKKNIFTRIKDKWNSLDQLTKDWVKVTGIWAVDGFLLGSLFTAAKKDAKYKKDIKTAVTAGYLQGQMDTYKEMATNNPFATFKPEQIKKF